MSMRPSQFMIQVFVIIYLQYLCYLLIRFIDIWKKSIEKYLSRKCTTCVKIWLRKGPGIVLSLLKHKSCHPPARSTASSFETSRLVIVVFTFVAITVVLTTAIIISLKNTEAAFGGPGTSSARPISHPRADLRQSPTVGKGTWKNVQQIPGGMRRLGVGRLCCYVNCFLNPVCVPVLVLINSFPNTELARLSSVDNKIVLRTLDFNWTPMSSKDLVRVWCCWLFISGENVTNLLKSLLFYKPGARF